MQFEGHYLGQFADHVLVRCPRCARCAHLRQVRREGGQFAGYRMVCPECAASADWLMERDRGCPMPSSGPELPGFGLQLWMQVPCCGEVLWAFNPAHVAFLEQYVGARLRERRRDPRYGWSNNSLESRLPRWMLLARYREAVLAGLAALRERATCGAV